MADNHSLTLLNTLHPKVRPFALAAYAEAVHATPTGVHPYISQTYRSMDESTHLYQLGRTIVNPDGKSAEKPFGDIVTNAPGGSSYHNYNLAIDFVNQINGESIWPDNPLKDENWMIVVNIFKKHGFFWGGDFPGSFKDYPHFEMRFGYNWRSLLAKYKAKDFIKGTTYLNL